MSELLLCVLKKKFEGSPFTPKQSQSVEPPFFLALFYFLLVAAEVGSGEE